MLASVAPRSPPSTTRIDLPRGRSVRGLGGLGRGSFRRHGQGATATRIERDAIERLGGKGSRESVYRTANRMLAP